MTDMKYILIKICVLMNVSQMLQFVDHNQVKWLLPADPKIGGNLIGKDIGAETIQIA